MSEQYDIVIIGAGMMGLALATALSHSNFSIAVVESKMPILTWNDKDYDARVSAIHLGTQAFLESLGVWSSIRPSCYSPLERMEVWDAQGGGHITFNASDINKDVLGYIVENREMVRVLWEHCEAHRQIHLLSNTKPETLSEDTVTFKNKQNIKASLIVGADGANSWLRHQMNVECIAKPYYQEALVAVIETEKPHGYTAYQPFLTTGPLGILPLPNEHYVAIVWSANIRRVQQLLSMSLENFNRELMNALNSKLGKLHCLSERKRFALIERHATHYVDENKVLVGDAAHTIHPLAGQGANLGFMDVACLAKVLKDARKENKPVNSYKILRRYERWRKSENEIMRHAMSEFHALFSTQSAIAVNLRSWGFNFTNHFHLLKRCLMRYAVHENFP